jgi:hypothetical protein
MLKAFNIAALSGILASLLASVPMCAAQASDTAVPAPVPAQIRTAKRVFISNLGSDVISRPLFVKEAEIDKPYNRFNAAMKAWGRYTLVDNPDDADQVFEIRFNTAITSTDKIDTYAPELILTIVDAKTHFTLWTVAEPVKGAFLKTTWDKNFNQGISNLMDELKTLTAPARAALPPPGQVRP